MWKGLEEPLGANFKGSSMPDQGASLRATKSLDEALDHPAHRDTPLCPGLSGTGDPDLGLALEGHTVCTEAGLLTSLCTPFSEGKVQGYSR